MRRVYKKWCGVPYEGKHPTHVPVSSDAYIPPKQMLPGYCLLCPMTDIHPNLCRLKRHFAHLHIKYKVTVQDMQILACKCSDVRNQGTDGSNRNLHYHCHVCNWPRTQKHYLFVHLTTQHNFTMVEVGHLMRDPKSVKQLEKEKRIKKARRDKNKQRKAKKK